MFSGFKNLFKSQPKTTNSKSNDTDDVKKFEENNSENFSEQDTAEKTAFSLEKEEEKMRFRLAMDIFKLEDNNRTNYEINLYDTGKMFETYFSERLKNWTYSELKDDWRPDYSSKKGGIELKSSEMHTLIRSGGYEVIKQIGKKILNGDFNLTTISFPIKVMLPLTILQTIALSIFQFPVYMNLAGIQNDPLERFKYVIVASLSCFHSSSHFLKPLNPILGETYEMLYNDGSKVFLEQTCHHPPISHYYMIGPNNNYIFHGFSNFSSNAGLNSLKLQNKGKRYFQFKDGQTISTNFCYEYYNNSLIGTIRHESLGETSFIDSVNGIECLLKYAAVKGKPSDYVSGEIKMNNKVVSKVYGSYLNFMEIDGLRYWDIRENIPVKDLTLERQLPSSSIYREDRILLEKGLIEQAQMAKEKLENLQRADRKFREKYSNTKHK